MRVLIHIGLSSNILHNAFCERRRTSCSPNCTKYSAPCCPYQDIQAQDIHQLIQLEYTTYIDTVQTRSKCKCRTSVIPTTTLSSPLQLQDINTPERQTNHYFRQHLPPRRLPMLTMYRPIKQPKEFPNKRHPL